MTIFSNLLNAYATIDSKHDITGKLVKQATSWLGVEDEEGNAKNGTSASMESRETTQSTSSTSDLMTTISTTATTPTTRNGGGAFDAIVVDNNGLPPVKSNVNPSQPLREKPPSEGFFRATPKPLLYSNVLPHRDLQFGVSNPHFFSEEVPQATEAYGPTDFLVETVKLDKNFLHQFFTSKPVLLGTDVVTSTSVKVKRGRESSGEVMDGPESLLDAMLTGDAKDEEKRGLPSFLKNLRPRPTELPTTRRTTAFPIFTRSSTTTTAASTTTSTTTTTTTTTRQLAKMSKVKHRDSPAIIVKNVHKFQRYNIPPEAKVTHHLKVPNPSQLASGGPRQARQPQSQPQQHFENQNR